MDKKDIIITVAICVGILIAIGIVAGFCIYMNKSIEVEDKEFVGMYYGTAPDGSASTLIIKGDNTFTEDCYNLSGTWERHGVNAFASDECYSPHSTRSLVFFYANVNEPGVIRANITLGEPDNYTTDTIIYYKDSRM